MLAALAAGSAMIAAGDVCLIVVCWKHRAVLAGLLGTVGIALVAFAVAAGLTGSVGERALVIAAITLVVGVGLYGLGQILERLLNGEQKGETCDASYEGLRRADPGCERDRNLACATQLEKETR